MLTPKRAVVGKKNPHVMHLGGRTSRAPLFVNMSLWLVSGHTGKAVCAGGNIAYFCLVGRRPEPKRDNNNDVEFFPLVKV